ncbi:MAG: hypothetical protein PHQ75_13690 [Thermoguttaceae bacterium]|nr:hypothetical protein [Thermoguttaceae bacterium]
MTTLNLFFLCAFSVPFGFLWDIDPIGFITKVVILILFGLLILPVAILLSTVFTFVCSKLHIVWIVMYPVWTLALYREIRKRTLFWPVARIFLSQPVPAGTEADLPDANAPSPNVNARFTVTPQSFLPNQPGYYDPVLGQYYNQVAPLNETDLFVQGSKWAQSHDFTGLGSLCSNTNAWRHCWICPEKSLTLCYHMDAVSKLNALYFSTCLGPNFTLVTTNSPCFISTPYPPNQFIQCFDSNTLQNFRTGQHSSGLSARLEILPEDSDLDVLLKLHMDAIEYLAAHVGAVFQPGMFSFLDAPVPDRSNATKTCTCGCENPADIRRRIQENPLPFRYRLAAVAVQRAEEHKQHLKTFLFWPFRMVFWITFHARSWGNRTIEEQVNAGLYPGKKQ